MTPLALLVVLAGGAAAPEALPPDVHRAVVEAVRARVGADADVVVEPSGPVGAWPDGRVVVDAELPPGASTRAPMRIYVRASVPGAAGPTVARVAAFAVDVRVAVSHWHTTRAVRRGGILDARDLVQVRHVLAPGTLQRPAGEVLLVGSRVARDLAAGACLSTAPVLPALAVLAGDEVNAVLRLPGVEVRTRMVAVDAGKVGAAVRVRALEGKTVIRARIVGRGEVEIVDGR